MILVLILVGMAITLVSRRWTNRTATLLAACAVIAVLWGVLVADGIAGGIFLGLVNLAIGVGIGAGIEWTLKQAGDGPVGRGSDGSRSGS